MSIRGAQDHAVIGGRCFFRRNPVGGVKQPLVDLGTVKSITPNQEVTKVELEDPEGGTSRVVDSQVTKVTETWDLAIGNTSLEIMSLAMRSERPEDFAQSANEAALNHFVTPGHLFGLEDAAGERVFNVGAVAAVLSAPVSSGVLSTATITTINRAARTITAGSDISADLAPGDSIVVQATDLTNIKNSRSYTVASTSGAVITVVEQPAADESAITGALIYKASGDSGTVYEQGADWEPADLARGYVRAIDGGAISAAAELHVIYTPNALSGARLVRPQSTVGNIEGRMELHLDKDAFGRRNVREAEVSVAPNGMNFPTGDFADITLTFTVLNDLTNAANPAGRFVQISGDLPSKS